MIDLDEVKVAPITNMIMENGVEQVDVIQA